MSLFNLGNEYAALIEQLEVVYSWEPEYIDGKPVNDDGEIIADVEEYRAAMISTVMERLNAVSASFEESAGNIAAAIKNYTAEAAALKEQEKIFAARRKSKEKSAERLRQYLMQEMEHLGTPKIETVQAKISLRNNPESVQIPDERGFIKWAQENQRDDLLTYKQPEISKTAVKSALKGGGEIPGAALVRTVSVIIK